MRAFIQFFAERHILANLMTIMVLLFGISTLMTIQRDQYPQVDFGEMSIVRMSELVTRTVTPP